MAINSDGKATLWSAVVFAILAGIAVGLRLISKTFTKATYGADDWWALASLVLFYVWVAVAIWGTHLYSQVLFLDIDTISGVVLGGGGADIGTIAFDPATLKTYLMVSRTRSHGQRVLEADLFTLTVPVSWAQLLSYHNNSCEIFDSLPLSASFHNSKLSKGVSGHWSVYFGLVYRCRSRCSSKLPPCA